MPGSFRHPRDIFSGTPPRSGRFCACLFGGCCSVPVCSVLVARCEPVCSGGTSLSSPEHSSELYFSGLLGPVFQKYISLLFLPQAGDVLFVIQRDFTRAFPEKTTPTEKEYILTVPLWYRQDVFFYSSPIENGKVHLRTVSPGHMS